MSVSKASMDRYRDQTFVAAYLEAEWGDKLVKHGVRLSFVDGLNPPCLSKFYENVALFARQQIGKRIGTICDVGCSTGRFLYDFCRTFTGMTDVVGVDPSRVFTDYARRFLLQTGPRKIRIPIPDTQVRPRHVVLNREFFNSVSVHPKYKGIVKIVTGRGEDTRPYDYFDAVFCLNVVDRHRNPKQLVTNLGRLVKSQGWFFLASPMDWDKRFTKRDYWVDDLTELFPGDEWETKATTDIKYPFRYALRHQTNYVSQVVCMKRNPTR